MTNLRLKSQIILDQNWKNFGLFFFFENILAGAALNPPHLRYNYNPDFYILR